uniref:NADH dehydrogenase subunit 6 n=1 Tax=Rhopalopsole bulbifera TaxID=1926546 RepID=UPI0010C3B980|nr:NADH dehydrogenase subunit 6 [Rhopalopsole bulbifera]QBR55143.1 NADH dehydrogenase subunit 6 [Rhopalopsole bulbifera]
MFQFMLLSMNMILSVVFTRMSHPLAMGLMLLTQTLFICLLTGTLSQSFWFSYILFLVFIGGLLVLFIYMTSLASNEMFTMSVSTIMSAGIIFMLLTCGYLIIDSTSTLKNLLSSNMQDMFYLSYNSCQPLLKLYNQPAGLLTSLLIIYLFLTLIAVVKITSIHVGPLRQKN